MDDGGGTLFLESDGRFIGPGHAGIFEFEKNDETQYAFTFHFYDSDNNGVGTLGTQMLTWDSDGWPLLTNEIFSPGQ